MKHICIVLFCLSSGVGLAQQGPPGGSSDTRRVPEGTPGIIPISKITEALNAGYKPVTIGDLVDAADADAQTVRNLQKRLSELASDYDALVARYNRLAAVNSTAPVSLHPAMDNRQLMRALVLQSLFERNPGPMRIQVQTVDCTKTPALCVNVGP
jgi:hypothetical protein